MLRRAMTAGALVFAVLSPLWSASADAATLPARAEVRSGRCVEPDSFRWLVANRYHVEFTHVVATDIDRDGDIDILATTDQSVTVWVNDGAGHLTSQRPEQSPALAGHAPQTNWRGGDERSQPSTNDGAPTMPLLSVRAHSPPDLADARAARPDASAELAVPVRSGAPRAPPLS